MPFNGSGVFERVYDWTTDRDNGTKILAERVDTETDGIVAGINNIVDQTQGFIGAVKGTNGTEASPAYSFTDDADSGMYRVSADTLGFSVSGTLELQVEAGYVDAVNGLKIGGTAVNADAGDLNALETFLDTFSFPVSDGTNGQVLTTDGNGALTFTSATTGTVVTSGTPVSTDFARFTDATTIEGRSPAEARGDLELSTVSQVEAEAGTSTTTRAWTAERVKQAIVALGGSGTIVPISKTTASNDSAIDISLTGSYSRYVIRCSQVRPATNAVDFYMRTSADGGSSFDDGASDYSYAGEAGFDTSAAATFVFLNGGNAEIGNAGGEAVEMDIHISPADGTSYTYIYASGVSFDASAQRTGTAAARHNTTAIDAVRFYMSSGNIAAGEFHLYGVLDGDV